MARRGSAINEPRYIAPETVCIGDLIRVTRKHKDTEKSVTGRVADRQHYTHSTECSTADGVVLFTFYRHGTNNFRITLLDRPAVTNGALTLEGI